MKILKKMLSLFLTAAIMVGVICTGAVSASAAENEFEITAKYNLNSESMNNFSVELSGPIGKYAYQTFNEENCDGFSFAIMFFKNKPKSSDIVPDYSFANLEDRFYLVASIDKRYPEYFKAQSYMAEVGVSSNGGLGSGYTNIKENSVIFYEQYMDWAIADITDYKYAVVVLSAFKTNDSSVKLHHEMINISWKKSSKVPTRQDLVQYENEYKISHTSLLNYKPSSADSTSTSSSSKNISSLSISKISDKTYTGKAIKPSVTVKDGDTKLKKGTDYTVSYKNNKNIGTVSVTIKGKGDYTGSKTIDFKIVPAKTTLKASKQSDTKVKLTWDKVKNAEKYQIYYSTNGGKYKKLATVSGSKTSYTNSKLDFKKNDYKFKIRAYDKVDGTTYYGSYSKAVTVK